MKLQKKDIQDSQTSPRFYLLGWWLSPRRRCLGILLALREHPSSCIFYKSLQCAGLWFHRTSRSRLWPRSMFLPEDRKDADHSSWLAHVPNRGHFAQLFAVEGLKAALHALPGCWEQPFLCRSSPQPVFTPGICFDGDTHRSVGLWLFPYTPSSLNIPPNVVISATRGVRVSSHTSRNPWQPQPGDRSPGRRTFEKPACLRQRDAGAPDPGPQHSPSSVSSALQQRAGLLGARACEGNKDSRILYRLSENKSAYCTVTIPASGRTPACSTLRLVPPGPLFAGVPKSTKARAACRGKDWTWGLRMTKSGCCLGQNSHFRELK